MKTLFKPARLAYFIAACPPERKGELFRIEVDDVADVAIAVHEDGFRRLLGLSVWMTRKISKWRGWRAVRRYPTTV